MDPAELRRDPYLNASKTVDRLNGGSVAPSSLLVLGSGLWYLRNLDSGGLAAWGTMIHKHFESLKAHQGSPQTALLNPWDSMKLGSGVKTLSLMPLPDASAASSDAARAALLADVETYKRDAWHGSGSNDYSVADAVMFLPVTDPVRAKLSAERSSAILHTDVEAMNADLFARLMHPSPPPVIIPTAFNRLHVESETDDGLHFSPKITGKQAELLLGWRCNDAVKKSANGLCCKRYDWTRPLQALLVVLLAVWAPVGFAIRQKMRKSYSVLPGTWADLSANSSLTRYCPPASVGSALATFGLAIGYCFVADRSTVFMKENKVYDQMVFGVLTTLALVAGLATVKNGGKDLGFLNRDVTDEWKGWMQSKSSPRARS